MPNDPIVAEIRRVREAHAAQFHYDLDAIYRDLKAKEQASGRQYVRNKSRPSQVRPKAAVSQTT